MNSNSLADSALPMMAAGERLRDFGVENFEHKKKRRQEVVFLMCGELSNRRGGLVGAVLWSVQLRTNGN